MSYKIFGTWNEYEERVKAVLPSSGPTRGSLTLYCCTGSAGKSRSWCSACSPMHNFEMTVDAYVLLFANRTNRLKYNTKVYKRRKGVDVDDFNKLHAETLKSIHNEYSIAAVLNLFIFTYHLHSSNIFTYHLTIFLIIYNVYVYDRICICIEFSEPNFTTNPNCK